MQPPPPPPPAHPGGLGLPNVDRGPDIIIATTIVTIVALITVFARLYVRVFAIRNVGLDDYTMLLTMVLSFTGWVVTIFEVKKGAGKHHVYVGSPQQIADALHLNFVTQAIYLWAIGLVKVAIGLFLVRFALKKKYKIFIWVVIVAMAIYTTICFLTLVFQCHNINTVWDMRVKSKCFSPVQLLTLSYTNTALNILTDLIFAFLPAIMFRNLQINRRQKISLVGILSLGVFACAAAIVKLKFLSNYGKTGDVLWDSANITIWVVVECNTGIIAGSLPTLKPLFKRFPSTYGSNSYRYRSSGQKKYIFTTSGRSENHGLQSLSRNRDVGSHAGKSGSRSRSQSGRGIDILDMDGDLEMNAPGGNVKQANLTFIESASSSGSNDNDHDPDRGHVSDGHSERGILPSAAAPGVGIVCTTTTEVRVSEPADEHRIVPTWNGMGYHMR